MLKDGLEQGKAAITLEDNLKARLVIHTVGPIWCGSKQQDPVVETYYHNSLALSKKKNILSSSAFQAISTGIYGYTMKKASQFAIGSIANYFTHKQSSFETSSPCPFYKE